MQNPSIDLKRGAEGARYALVRRLAPAIWHQIAGSFQPVTMMTAFMEKRLQATSPDLPALAKTSKEARQLAIAAARSNLDLIGWIGPEPEALVPLGQGVQEGLHWVATELSFRGFICVNQTEGVAVEVPLSHLRGVFVAALLAVTDSVELPGTVLVKAHQEGIDAVVTIALTDVDIDAKTVGSSNQDFRSNVAAYRKIDWSDVEAMAAMDGVALEHASTNVVLRLPIR